MHYQVSILVDILQSNRIRIQGQSPSLACLVLSQSHANVCTSLPSASHVITWAEVEADEAVLDHSFVDPIGHSSDDPSAAGSSEDDSSVED